MKEKERFEVLGSLACLIADTESSSIMNVLGILDCCDLLNAQDKALKEKLKECEKLTQENEDLKDKLKCACQKYHAKCEYLHNQANQLVISSFKNLTTSILDFSNGYWRFFMKNGEEYMKSADLESCLKEFTNKLINELKGE